MKPIDWDWLESFAEAMECEDGNGQNRFYCLAQAAPKVSEKALRALIALHYMAGRAGDPGHIVFCLPSNVARHSGLSEAEATEALAELVQKCVIQDDGPFELPGQIVREYQVMPWFEDADEWEGEE